MRAEDFYKLLREQVTEICDEMGLNPESERGTGFEHWCARFLVDARGPFDVEAEEAVHGRSGDLKADLILPDLNRRQLVIGQTKFIGQNRNVDEDEVSSFFGRHTQYMDLDWVRKNGGPGVSDYLLEYADLLDKHGWTVELLFITTGRASSRVQALAAQKTREYTDTADGNVSCELWTTSKLKEHYLRLEAREERIPDHVSFELPSDGYIEFSSPHKGVVARVTTNGMRNLWQKHRDSLFAYNIRGNLGHTSINKQMVSMLKEQPQNFFYFNNGISAICTSFEVQKGTQHHRLEADSLQVINGAQTLNAIRLAEETNAQVVFRLTETVNVKTDKGLNQDIIRYNNKQNPMKDSDFRANDPIQVHIERRFSNRKKMGKVALGVMPRFEYRRKRRVGRPKAGAKGLRLEDFARIRYAWLWEPTQIMENPKSLFADADAGGRYHEAFGVDGQVVDAWTDAVFEDALLAVAFWIKNKSSLGSMYKLDPREYHWVRMHRWIALSLAGLFARMQGVNVSATLRNADSFEKLWREFSKPMWEALQSGNLSRPTSQTPRGACKAPSYWESVRARFETQVQGGLDFAGIADT